MASITTCLWHATAAEEAASFYVSLVPNSRIEKVHRLPADGPGGKAGTVLQVEFTLAGQSFSALNGGSGMPSTDAISISVSVDTQAEIDRLWDGLVQGGKEVQCGWLKDRWGVSWQIVPRQLAGFLGDPDREKAGRAMQAMLKMVKLDIGGLQRAFDGD